MKNKDITQRSNAIFDLTKKKGRENAIKIIKEEEKKEGRIVERISGDLFLKYSNIVEEEISKSRQKYFEEFEKTILKIDDLRENDETISIDEGFEIYKEFLKDVLGLINLTGALSDLVKNENNLIRKINNFMTTETQINEISIDNIYDQIENLTPEKDEDKIKLLIWLRHYTNKLAHNYDDYIFNELRNATISENEFNQRPKRFTKESIVKGNNEFNTDKVQGIFAYLKELKAEGYNNRNRFYKIIKAKIDSGEDIEKILEFVNDNIRFKLEFSSLDTYCESVYGADGDMNKRIVNFELLKRKFENIKNSNKLVKDTDFFSFCEAVIDKNEDNQKFRINGFENLANELESFIDLLEKDKIIKEPKNIIKRIAKMSCNRDKIFDVKHLFTRMIVEYSKNSDKIYVEKDEINEKDDYNSNKKRVIDITCDGYYQVFGTHGEKPNKEVNDNVDQIINKAFDGMLPINLCINVPLEKLTYEQRLEFKKIFNVIAYIEGKKENLSDDEKVKEKIFKKIFKAMSFIESIKNIQTINQKEEIFNRIIKIDEYINGNQENQSDQKKNIVFEKIFEIVRETTQFKENLEIDEKEEIFDRIINFIKSPACNQENQSEEKNQTLKKVIDIITDVKYGDILENEDKEHIIGDMINLEEYTNNNDQENQTDEEIKQSLEKIFKIISEIRFRKNVKEQCEKNIFCENIDLDSEDNKKLFDPLKVMVSLACGIETYKKYIKEGIYEEPKIINDKLLSATNVDLSTLGENFNIFQNQGVAQSDVIEQNQVIDKLTKDKEQEDRNK